MQSAVGVIVIYSPCSRPDACAVDNQSTTYVSHQIGQLYLKARGLHVLFHTLLLTLPCSSATHAAADGFKMDGRRWKVDWASRADFDLFGWRWTEGRSPSPRR
jgi:hypothetical protein